MAPIQVQVAVAPPVPVEPIHIKVPVAPPVPLELIRIEVPVAPPVPVEVLPRAEIQTTVEVAPVVPHRPMPRKDYGRFMAELRRSGRVLADRDGRLTRLNDEFKKLGGYWNDSQKFGGKTGWYFITSEGLRKAQVLATAAPGSDVTASTEKPTGSGARPPAPVCAVTQPDHGSVFLRAMYQMSDCGTTIKVGDILPDVLREIGWTDEAAATSA